MLVQTSPEDFLRSVDDAKAERRRQKEMERSAEHRVLDPWERYRALSDHYRTLQDVSEQGDRKTRFALLILGSINAVNLLIVMRGDMVGLPRQDGRFAIAYVALYALLSLAFFFYAIAALRPRAPRLQAPSAADGEDAPPALRLPSLVLAQTPEEYCETWQRVEVGQLNRELAFIIHETMKANAIKARALHRVYVGLYVLVGLTAALLVVLAWTALHGTA